MGCQTEKLLRARFLIVTTKYLWLRQSFSARDELSHR